MVIFEWDEEKAKSNLRKHRVSFEEGESVFYDPRTITISDPNHSDDEFRFIDLGISNRNRVLVVVYTERKHRIRIVSVRKATRYEQKQYEQDR